jgi:hypothetical protein
MKTTIELTKNQIELLVKADKEQLLNNKTNAIEELEKNFEKELLKLNEKYKTVTIDTDSLVPAKKGKAIRTKLDTELVTSMFTEGKSVKEISGIAGKSELAIRAALKKLGLKLADRK